MNYLCPPCKHLRKFVPLFWFVSMHMAPTMDFLTQSRKTYLFWKFLTVLDCIYLQTLVYNFPNGLHTPTENTKVLNRLPMR